MKCGGSIRYRIWGNLSKLVEGDGECAFKATFIAWSSEALVLSDQCLDVEGLSLDDAWGEFEGVGRPVTQAGDSFETSGRRK